MDSKQLAAAVAVMQTEPTLRSKEQVHLLCKLTLKWKYFQALQHEPRFPNLHRLACSALTCAEFREGQVVVHYGDYADAFFIVVKGLLSISLPKKKLKAAIEGDEQEDNNPHNGLGREGIIRAPTLPTEEVEEQKLKEVTTLSEGDHFGELSLLRGLTRSASVECKSASILAVLPLKTFRLSLGIFEEQKLNRKMEFLMGLPVFYQWTKTAISRMTYFLQPHHCFFGSILFRERSKCDSVYIIEEGEFKLSQRAVISQKYKDSFSFLYGSRKTPCDKSLKPLMKKRVKTQTKHLQVRLSQLVIKARGELVGDLEALDAKPYEATCICTSETGKVLIVPADVSPTQQFRRFMKHPYSAKYIQSKILSHGKANHTRFQSLIQIEELKNREISPCKADQSFKLKGYSRAVSSLVPSYNTSQAKALNASHVSAHTRSISRNP
jgi:CRP-like cAMP-binding protein